MPLHWTGFFQVLIHSSPRPSKLNFSNPERCFGGSIWKIRVLTGIDGTSSGCSVTYWSLQKLSRLTQVTSCVVNVSHKGCSLPLCDTHRSASCTNRGLPDSILLWYRKLCRQESSLLQTGAGVHFSFGKRMPWLTKFCLETDRFHEHFIIFLPERMTFRLPPVHDTFHVVCQYIAWDPHISKRMYHPNKKIFLSGIGKEFDISFPAVMADHSKTCSLIGCTCIRIYLYKSPVHLIGFPRGCLVSAPSVSLWGNDLTFGWDKLPMIRDISFYGCQSTTYPASCSRSKHTEELVTPFRGSPSMIPLYPVRTVAAAFCPVRP